MMIRMLIHRELIIMCHHYLEADVDGHDRPRRRYWRPADAEVEPKFPADCRPRTRLGGGGQDGMARRSVTGL